MAIMMIACNPAKQSVKTSAKVIQTSEDSIEYELVIVDLNFDHWYLMNYSPAKDHTNELYRSKNQIAVANWNYYYQQGLYTKVIESLIDYRPEIDYGIEVNRKLYWYFKYVGEEYKIRLFNTIQTP